MPREQARCDSAGTRFMVSPRAAWARCADPARRAAVAASRLSCRCRRASPCSSSMPPRKRSAFSVGGRQHERLARRIGRRNVARDIERVAAQREFADAHPRPPSRLKVAGEMRVIERRSESGSTRDRAVVESPGRREADLAERLRVGGLRRLDAHRRQQRAQVEVVGLDRARELRMLAECAAARRPRPAKPPNATVNSLARRPTRSPPAATTLGTSSLNGTPVGARSRPCAARRRFRCP